MSAADLVVWFEFGFIQVLSTTFESTSGSTLGSYLCWQCKERKSFAGVTVVGASKHDTLRFSLRFLDFLNLTVVVRIDTYFFIYITRWLMDYALL